MIPCSSPSHPGLSKISATTAVHEMTSWKSSDNVKTILAGPCIQSICPLYVNITAMSLPGHPACKGIFDNPGWSDLVRMAKKDNARDLIHINYMHWILNTFLTNFRYISDRIVSNNWNLIDP